MTAPTTTRDPARRGWHGTGRGRRAAGGAAGRARGEASAVRALTTHPDVIALRVEKVRAQVDALLWAGIVLALGFTMVNVQSFAATGAPRWSAGWWVAWLLDPMVSLVLLAVLRAEQVTARYQVPLTAWARRTKWLDVRRHLRDEHLDLLGVRRGTVHRGGGGAALGAAAGGVRHRRDRPRAAGPAHRGRPPLAHRRAHRHTRPPRRPAPVGVHEPARVTQ